MAGHMTDKRDRRSLNTGMQMLCGFGPEENYLRFGAAGDAEVKILLQTEDPE